MILITGNPVDGFAYFGPFETSEDAIAYADEYLNHETWWLTELTSPQYEATDEEIDRSFDAYR